MKKFMFKYPALWAMMAGFASGLFQRGPRSAGLWRTEVTWRAEYLSQRRIAVPWLLFNWCMNGRSSHC